MKYIKYIFLILAALVAPALFAMPQAAYAVAAIGSALTAGAVAAGTTAAFAIGVTAIRLFTTGIPYFLLIDSQLSTSRSAQRQIFSLICLQVWLTSLLRQSSRSMPMVTARTSRFSFWIISTVFNIWSERIMVSYRSENFYLMSSLEDVVMLKDHIQVGFISKLIEPFSQFIHGATVAQVDKKDHYVTVT